MTAASRDNIPIRKHNVIAYYSRAREKAFTLKTIKNSFRKTGIWPIDPNVIEDDAFAPALNTTTEAAQPVPASIPECVVVVPSKAPTSTPDASPVVSVATTSSDGTTATDTVTFTIKVPKGWVPGRRLRRCANKMTSCDIFLIRHATKCRRTTHLKS